MREKSKIDRLVNEYKPQEAVYKDFANTIKFILETLLKNNSFQYQIVTCREKKINSLRKKLVENKNLQKLKKVNKIDDLAGCRIIFYFESDIQKFVNYIYQEFDVVKQNLKYSPDDYNASHLVVKLNKNRLKLIEYSKFVDLRCEIQLTTVLYHAWSEVAHDVVYRPSKEFSSFDKRAFESLKKQFSDVMEDHIKQAQYTFDFIARETEKIKQGKQVFDTRFLKDIMQIKSNNEIYGNLKLLYRYVKEFGDKTPEELDIINVLKLVLEKSKSIKTEPIKTVLGDLDGHNHSDIASVSLDILNQLRYFHTEKVFTLLIHLSHDIEPSVKKKTLKVLGNISKYNLQVLKKIGYYPQLLILGKIEKWSNENLIENIDPIVEIAKQLLSPSFENHSMKDYNTFIFQSGSLNVGDQIKDIRNRTISLMQKLYDVSKNLTQRKRVIQILQEATQTPHQKNYSENMENMILENTNTLIEYYISIVPRADNEIIKEIEEQTYRFIRRYTKEKLPIIENLQSVITSNKEYDIYRVFVGHDNKFNEEMDWHKAEGIRKNKIQEYLRDILEENFDDWEKRILSIIKNYSSEDSGKFQYFNIFLNELGEQKPKIAFKLLTEKENKLEPFLIHLVAGIWKSKLPKLAKGLISKWIDENKHLFICAYTFSYVKEMDKLLLDKIFKKAKENKDTDTLNNIIQSIVRNYPKHKNTKTLFVNTIKELTKNNNWWWINNVWYCKESILKSLTKNDFDVILENLLLVPSIDFHGGEILTQVAEKYPEKVIDFFHKRVTIQTKKKWGDRYDAVPFELHKLNEPLCKHAKIVIPEIFKWFTKNNWLLYLEGSHLLQAIFPSFDKVLEQELIKLIKSKNKKKAEITISILRAYKGEGFLHNVCKEFIKKYSKNDKYQKEMFIILSQMGVVLGEYGFVEGYKRKKEAIQSWKSDKNKAIRSFAKSYETYLDKQIAYEQKRADDETEFRKRNFEY